MSLRAKRSPSPLPLHLDNIRKIRLITKKEDRDKSQDRAVTASFTDPHHGQEVISFSPFLPQTTRHENINDLILQTTARLAQEGKRLTRAPQLLPDGIAFEWVADLTARGDNLKKLLSVQGIRSADLDKVLLRALPSASRASTLEPSAFHVPQDRALSLNVNTLPLSLLLQGDASNPIIIDEDDENTEIMSTSLPTSKAASRSTRVQFTQTPAGEPSSSNNVSVASASPLTGSSKQALGLTSPTQDNVASPSRLPSYDSDAPQRPRTLRSRASVGGEAAHLIEASHDRASVVTYASSPCPTRPEQIPHDMGDSRNESDSLATNSPNDDVMPPCDAADSIPARNPPNTSRRREEKRRADYGDWKSFVAESSDAEMDDVHPSSRDSSPDRVLPVQPMGRIPGLGFLPQTYDTSSLVAVAAAAPTARPDRRSETESPLTALERPPRNYNRRVKFPQRVRSRATKHADDLSSDAEASDGPPHRSALRRKIARPVLPMCCSSDHDKSDQEPAAVKIERAYGCVSRQTRCPFWGLPT
ncbi:hypothetical protein C2E23DRAFT_94684 [Lenzites betulinus]|nr:hypothetical protein C2E23DRAFT_94684 [Lenzites betulinus]